MKRLALLLLLLGLALPAQAAAAGRLDPGFGTGGRAIAGLGSVGGLHTLSGQSAVAPDGRIFVLLYDGTLLAFTPNGEPDRGFGAGGSLALIGPDDVRWLGPIDIAVDPRGRIVVASTVNPLDPPDPGFTNASPDQNQAILVARFSPGGQPDPSFGSGGRVVTKLGFPPPAIDPALGWNGANEKPRVTSAGVAIDAAGRIVLSGNYVAGYGACADQRGYEDHRTAFLARLDETGRPDPSFGGAGVALLGEGSIRAPAVDPSGGVFASVGAPTPLCAGSQRRAAGLVFHLDAAGVPVAGFGRGGWRPIPEDAQTTLLPDSRGGLVLMPGGGGWHNWLIFRRLRADGEWDPGFGKRGTANPFPSPQGSLHFTDAVLGAGDDVYVTANWVRKPRANGPKRRFVLFHLDRRGRLDRDYGVVRTGFGKESFAWAQDLLLAPGGKPLALGPLSSPLLPGSNGLALARYLPG